jgi:hypothetical protein
MRFAIGNLRLLSPLPVRRERVRVRGPLLDSGRPSPLPSPGVPGEGERSLLALPILLTLLFGATSAAAAPQPDPAAPIIAQITAKLSASDRPTIDSGLSDLRKFLDAAPPRAIASLRLTWMAQLMSAGRYDDIDALTVHGILAAPQDPAAIDFFLTSRVRALLAAGKTDAALTNARALYNVCPMASVSNAMLLVAQCLSAVQQMAGAADPSRDSPIDTGPSVLASIALDGREFRPALAKMIGEDFPSLTARGNLLLICGGTAEAGTVFERAYSLAPDAQLSAATESIARCMKAQDAAIGRANTWLLSLRPLRSK